MGKDMRIGIFGAADDPQVQAVARAANALGVGHVRIDPGALDAGQPISSIDGSVSYLGEALDDVRGFYVRSVPSPSAPVVESESGLVLYKDWFTLYMQARERSAFYVSWLLNLQASGVFLANPPQAGSMFQYKPHQLHLLRTLGARVPKTLISNDPSAIRRFRDEVGDVIFKPLLGGALTRSLDEAALAKLDLVTASPVIFQERIHGDDLRIMVAGDRVVSSVAIVTPEQHLDFRGDPAYSGGEARYREVELPAAIADLCVEAARACGLAFAGIDIKHRNDDWVFLELNSSPIYLDVELKLGHPISRAVAELVIAGAG